MKWKILRITVSGVLLGLFVFSFIVKNRFTDYYLDKFAYIQFISGLTEIIKSHQITIAFIILLILIILFGRFYCSFICPLGTLQDIPLIFRKNKNFSYTKSSLLLRYAIPVVSIIFFLFSVSIILELTEPYSISARICNIIFSHTGYKPGVIPIRETISIITVLVFISILFLSFFKGRFYCNSICPIGAVLSVIAYFSIFKIKIIKNKCVSCKKCEQVCKAECIDSTNKKIDNSKCILCLNCLNICKLDALKYTPFKIKGNPKNISKARRDFIALGGIGLLTFLASKITPREITKKIPATPPGSKGIKHFTGSCIACQLCVTKCPTGVLRPSFLEYGFTGMMQPFLDFTKNFCDYNCTDCSKCCPTGAIKPLPLEKKQKISLGNSFIDENICVVYKNNTACAACQEICPTGAVYMINYKNGLPAPKINNNICIGCGACEHSCPTIPIKAITVKPFAEHKTIKELPQNTKQITTEKDTDFAF